jgi:hypothetical protein
MRHPRIASVLVACLHVTAIAAPAFAQDVHPVPYGTSQPVPYGAPAPVAAPAVGRDVIYLKNGGLLRGTLIDVIPNSHARIQLETGEIATVEWSEINRIDHASTTPQAPPQVDAPRPPSAPEAPPSQALAGPSKRLLVHIETTGQDLYLLADTGHEWERVCSAPCDKWLSGDVNYKLAGPSVRQSKPFYLQGENGDRVILDVNTASSGIFVLGVVGTVVGSVSVGLGALVWLVGVATNASCSIDASTTTSSASGSCSSSSGKSAESVGGTMMLAGLVVGVAGIVAIATNGHTSVAQDVQEPVKRGEPRSDAWLHLPAWNETTTTARTAPSFGMPLLSGSF